VILTFDIGHNHLICDLFANRKITSSLFLVTPIFIFISVNSIRRILMELSFNRIANLLTKTLGDNSTTTGPDSILNDPVQSHFHQSNMSIISSQTGYAISLRITFLRYLVTHTIWLIISNYVEQLRI
jgi:hypothetical protein